MNNTITEMKNTLEGINNRITEAEERISELEDKMVELTLTNKGGRVSKVLLKNYKDQQKEIGRAHV